MFYEPLVTRDDIEQEAALVRLLGKTNVSKGLIRMKLERQAKSQLNYEEVFDPDRDVDIPDIRELTSGEELRLWAMDMSQEVQELINHFLEDPNTLESTMKALAQRGIITALLDQHPSISTKTNYTSMMKRALPASKDDLIKMITAVGTMERPASTVRAFLRRFANNLELDKQQIYHWRP